MSLLDDTYVSFVNLDHRKDRLDLMLQSLARSNLSATRTRGRLPAECKAPPERISAMLKRPQKGAIGCYFSQMSIMEEAGRMGKHAFVMEDDLIICADLHERLAIVEQFTFTHPWDVVWMGGTFHINPPYWHKEDIGRDAELTDHPRFLKTYGAFCTYAYIVNRESLCLVLTLLESVLPQSIGIDHSFILIQPKLRTFAFVPGCMTQYDNQSDIGKGVTKFSGFAKLGPYWFQQRMTDFDPLTFDWHEARV